MTRALAPSQETLSQRRSLTPVTLLRITTSDGGDFAFSDTAFTFDGVDYEPFLERLDDYTESMLHLPDPGVTAQGQLYRDFSFVLRNGETSETVGTWRRRRLIEVLRDFNLELATVSVGQILLDSFAYPSEQDAIQRSTDTPTFFFRGELSQVASVSNEEIVIRCSSIQPTGGMGNALVLNDDASNGILSIGRRHNVVYGLLASVPVASVSRTTESTLASPLGGDPATDTSLLLSDGSRFPDTGTIIVGGEICEYAGRTEDVLTGLVRGAYATQAVQHAVGELVTQIPGELVLSAGLNPEAVGSLYFLNPVNGGRFQVTTTWGQERRVDASTQLDYLAVTMSLSDLILQMRNSVEQAIVTQQAEYESSGGGANPSTNERTPGGTLQNVPIELSLDRGDWTTGPVWTYDPTANKRGGSIEYTGSDGLQSRTMVSARLFIKWRLDSFNFPGAFSPPGRFTVAAYAPDVPGFGLTTAAVASIDLSPLPTPPTESEKIYSPEVSLVDLDLDEDTLVGLPIVLIAKSGNGDLRSGDSFSFTVLEYGLEITTVNKTNIQERVIDATIEGIAGAFGAESSATVDLAGPLIPGVETEVYDFPNANWGTPSQLILSGTGNPLTFTADIPASTVVYDVENAGNLDSWSITGGTGWDASLAYATQDGRGAVEVTESSAFFPNAEVTKTNFSGADWSGGTILVDLWMRTISDSAKVVLVDGGGNEASWVINRSDYAYGAWASYELSDDRLLRDDGVDFTDIDEMKIIAGFRSDIGRTWYFGRVSVLLASGNGTINNTDTGSADMDTTGNYLLDCIPTNLANLQQLTIRLASDASFVDRRTMAFLPTDFTEGVRGKYQPTLVQDAGSLDPTNIIRLQWVIAVKNPSEPMPAFDVWSLLTEEDPVGYVGARDTAVEHPADVVRYHLTERCGVPASAIDEPSFSAAATNLGDNEVACVATFMAEDDSDFLTYLGQQHRFQLVQVEGATETLYRMLTAESDYTFPAPIRTIPDGDFECELVGFPSSEELVNRRAFLYDVDYALGTSQEAFRKAINVSTTKNDLSPNLDAELAASETAYGPRPGPTQTFVATKDEDTAKDVIEYNFREILRMPATYRLSDVPWVHAYDLVRGDIIEFRPTWEGEDTTRTKGRIIQVTKQWSSERVGLVVVEVL